MSTLTSASPIPRQPARTAPLAPPAPRQRSVRGLAAMLLAAMVAALVVAADRVISTWADGHLLLAWMVLWAVVFAALALFADVARGLAQRVMRGLDNWSRTLAQARAEARLWEMARSNPRLMRELQLARQRQTGSFDDALAPLGIEPVAAVRPATGWNGFLERLSAARSRQLGLYYI
ncbi:MAG: hypothetical protein EP306_07340 [Burkholderiales bacterium]|nr:MAG: hypothetical protein EP306_07340 [Burkholderiales bacterium]